MTKKPNMSDLTAGEQGALRQMGSGAGVVYEPRTTDDLRPEAQALLGKQLTVRFPSFVIEDGPYAGEQAIFVEGMPYWIPSGDLVAMPKDHEPKEAPDDKD